MQLGEESFTRVVTRINEFFNAAEKGSTKLYLTVSLQIVHMTSV